MSADNITNEISRRSIAKGAAWAAPVVALGAAAPALAASPVPCTPNETEGALSIDVIDCTLVGLGSAPYFRVTNLGECTVSAGEDVAITVGSLLGLDIDFLAANNNNLSAIYIIGNTVHAKTVTPLGPGESMDIKIYSPSVLSIGAAVGTQVTLLMANNSEGFNWSRVTLFGQSLFGCIDL